MVQKPKYFFTQTGIICLLLFVTVNVFSQTDSKPKLVRFEGLILDHNSKQPISGKVSYEKLPYADDMGLFSAGANGYFSFSVLETNTYRIKISADTYFPSIFEVKIEEGGSPLRKDTFYLKSSRQGEILRMEKLLFQRGRANILPESYPELETLLQMMDSYPEMVIQLEGHTDTRGVESKNLELSRERVEEVKSYLVKNGINKNRIKTKAFGGTQPISTENTEEAHQLNRRVEVRILKND
ncbi:OmpA family protein [Marinigracilibium pacificum]|uniref:OmpA family protein n=1 Tax=Marinigracilibium pacificum TaxID=2729599 RepID=A0A848IVA1_9BACT|nr:OmpA family protein [Marinigracilibium pacificum]NMM47118.1 OmpA family protein [Marinigracilibium pacificum]